MVYKHANLDTLHENVSLLHSTFMLSVVKMLLKRRGGEAGGHALNGHGKSWKNHGIVFLNFCGNPVSFSFMYMCGKSKSVIRFYN